jgi:regulator of cell morphogenesis and NO signaling
MDRLHDRTLPLDDMCDGIVERYHASLHRALPRIRGELDALAGAGKSPAFEPIRVAFSELADSIQGHLAKEENLLFPAVAALSSADRAGRGRPPLPFATILHPIRVMEAEHVRIENALEQLCELALEVPEPDAAAPAWRQCLSDLSHLDADLREHHQLENEILFPAALDLERRVL